MTSEGRSLPRATPELAQRVWARQQRPSARRVARAMREAGTQCILSRLLVGALKTGKEPYPNILWNSRGVELTRLRHWCPGILKLIFKTS